MENIWSIETQGDPLGAVTRFMEHIWRAARLDALVVSAAVLATTGASGDGGAQVLESVEELKPVNPFHPAMRSNLARFLPAILRARPNQRIGALLRPCEVRALDSLARIDPFPRRNLFTISVDCMGTYPTQDLSWRAGRQAAAHATPGPEFSRQGGINMYRYRPACQVCKTPKATGGDVNIGVLGMPARQSILVGTRQPETAQTLKLADFPVSPPPAALLGKRDQMLERVAERNAQTRARILAGLGGMQPANLEQLIQTFEACGDCQECLDACPICSVRRPAREASGRYKRQDVALWLAACAGCGMCEQACTRDLPLSVIFGRIREQLKAPVVL